MAQIVWKGEHITGKLASDTRKLDKYKSPEVCLYLVEQNMIATQYILKEPTVEKAFPRLP